METVYRFGQVLSGLTYSPFSLNGTVKVHVEKNVNHETRVVLEKFLRYLYIDELQLLSIPLLMLLNFKELRVQL